MTTSTDLPFHPRLASLVVLLVTLVLLAPAGTTSAQSPEQRDATLQQARALLAAQDALGVLRLLRPYTDRRKPDAEALVLSSEAQALLGNVESSFEDLERALAEDPSLRQGWLNLAGLEIAQGNLAEAQVALEKARDLDPRAEDNDLNLGAIQALRGRRAEARASFDSYLAGRPGSAEDFYTVASNYALAGWADLAVTTLERGIRLDERLRLRARGDDRFLALEQNPAYRDLLQRDLWTPPPGYLTAAAAFEVPWNLQDPRLLYAVLESLKEAGLHWQPTIETSASWALVWGGLRAKVATQADGTGVVSFSAPPDRWSPEDWSRLTQSIFRSIWNRLQNPRP